MSRKVTISVPDDLYERMATWRSSFNFSQVFQNAISQMIQKKEEFKNKMTEEIDFSSIAERLKKEKMEFEQRFFEKGKNDGFEWSKTAHYTELQYALKWRPSANLFKDEKLGDYFSSIMEKYKAYINKKTVATKKRIDFFNNKYAKGWKEGVEDFWNEVKDKI